MRMVRLVLLFIGVFAVLIGAVWIGQGLGVFPYPKQSFMINETVWAYRGIGVLIAGLFAILISRRPTGR